MLGFFLVKISAAASPYIVPDYRHKAVKKCKRK
jgi:hypothetical protein